MYLLGSMTGFRFYVKAGFKIQDCKKKLSLPFLFCKLRLDEQIKKKKKSVAKAFKNGNLCLIPKSLDVPAKMEFKAEVLRDSALTKVAASALILRQVQQNAKKIQQGRTR